MAEIAMLCEQCDDRGWIIERDGGAGTARRCGCRESVPAEELMARAGVPAEHQGSSFTNFDPAFNGPLPKEVLDYAGKPEGFLLLIGDPGRGKSHAAAAVLRASLMAGRRGLWCAVQRFVQSLKASGNWDEANRRVAALEAVELAILDDVGAEQETDFSRETVSRVIASRHAARLPTVVTTNKKIRELQSWEPRIASRLAFGVVVELAGRDYRLRRDGR